MGETAYFECRLCGKMCSMMILRRDHGPIAPKCVGMRSYDRMTAMGWRTAGNFTALLDAAGLCRRAPIYIWWRRPVDAAGNALDSWRDPAFATSRMTEMVEFYAFAPEWAYDLAKQLTTDRQLARKLGFTQKRKLVSVKKPISAKEAAIRKGKGFKTRLHEYGPEKAWQAVDLDKVLPVHIRAKILKVAANNELAREMIMDDPEAAGRIIMDVQ